jgi:hypothetical protein
MSVSLHLPASPSLKFVPVPNRESVSAVWRGCDHVGFIRYDAKGRFIARTTGNAASASDMRIFPDREKAGEWLSGAR